MCPTNHTGCKIVELCIWDLLHRDVTNTALWIKVPQREIKHRGLVSGVTSDSFARWSTQHQFPKNYIYENKIKTIFK